MTKTLRESLEPSALSPNFTDRPTKAWEGEVEASKAISARRQADALERIAAHLEPTTSGQPVEVGRTLGGVPAYRRTPFVELKADPVQEVADLVLAINRKNGVLARMADGWSNAIELRLIGDAGEDSARELARQARVEAELVR